MLSSYQKELLGRLTPVLDRLDRAVVTDVSGVAIIPARASRGWTLSLFSSAREPWNVREGDAQALVMSVELRDGRLPALDLYASPTECLLSVSDRPPVVERHGRIGADTVLAEVVMELVERYLAGIKVTREYDRRDRVVRTRYVSRRDGLPLFGEREGILAKLLCLGLTARTETFEVWFLKEDRRRPTSG